MPRSFLHFSCISRAAPPCALVLSGLLLSSLALAAPRVGTHGEVTRLAFDLPRAASAKVSSSAGGVTVTLSAPLRAEGGAVRSDDVTAYAVRPSGAGATVTLTLAAGRRASVFTLPAQDGKPPRLVVDVGTSVRGVAAQSVNGGQAAGKPAPPARAPGAQARPVVRPASARTPQRPTLRVVLDPGHGGVDAGMVGYVVEKEVTLSVALKVRDRLAARGIEVVMTRDRDTQLSVDKATDLNMRAAMANAGTVNAYVSIHVNAGGIGGANASGIETWVFGQLLENRNRALAVRENGGGAVGERVTRESLSVAQNLLGDLLSSSNLTYSRKLASMVQGKLVASTGATNRGIGTAPFAVIRNARTPAVLVEIGFGSNPVEGKKLALQAYRDRLADAIADAIAQFLHADEDIGLGK